MNNSSLPDILGEEINIIFCGLSAGKLSLMMQHYYADPGNRFWLSLKEAGLTEKQIIPSLNSEQREVNYKFLKSKKIGLTDLIKSGQEIKGDLLASEKDIERLNNLIKEYRPRVLAFNGKKAAQLYLNKINSSEIRFGELQNLKIGSTKVFILPSTSGAAKAFWSLAPWRELSYLVKKIKR